MAKVGGAVGELNYYTRLAVDMGYSTAFKSAEKTEAGFFVQANHNLYRLFTGRGPAKLWSSSAATVMGRTWQNQAIGLGIVNMSISTYGAYKTVSSGQ